MKDKRDCNNCKNYVPINIGVSPLTIRACKKWKCEFEPKILNNIKITVTFDEIMRLSNVELANLIMLRLNENISNGETEK